VVDLLRSGDLRIERENWLLDLIIKLDDEYRGLLTGVKDQFLSGEGLSKFLDQFDYRELTD
jgi:hypothetical protein